MNKKEREYIEDLREYGFCNWILGRADKNNDEDSLMRFNVQQRIFEIEEKYHFAEYFGEEK